MYGGEIKPHKPRLQPNLGRTGYFVGTVLSNPARDNGQSIEFEMMFEEYTMQVLARRAMRL